MEVYADSMQDGGAAGLAATKKRVQDRLAKENAEAMAEIEPLVSKMTSDKTIPDATRTRMRELWAIYTEAKTQGENPKPPMALYRSQQKGLADRLDRVVKALQTALGVDDLLDQP